MILINKSDSLGALASGLCLVHCVATPFLFVLQPLTVSEGAAPFWWQSLDFIFLAVSFVAVYRSAINTSKRWMRYALWISFIALTLAIVNEKFELLHIGEFMTYFPAASLIGLHLYNQKYCQCANTTCCATH